MKKKHLIIAGAIILLVAAAYYYFFPAKASTVLEATGLKTPTPATGTTKTGTVATSTITQDANGVPLMQGKSGSLLHPDQLINNIQKALNAQFKTGLSVDGIFGPKTAAALTAHNFPTVIYLDDYYEIMGV